MAYPITRKWLRPLLRLFIKKIKGKDNIPEGPFIIASNHRRLADPPFVLFPVLSKLKKKIHFISKPTWVFNKAMKILAERWGGCILLYDGKEAYKKAKNILEAGGIVGIFPEGSSKRNHYKTGAVRLSYETKLPILPVGIRIVIKPFGSTINIGKPYCIKSDKNPKRQTASLLKKIYALRDEK